MRLSGIASGMDTDSMIKELMRAERVKVDKVTQQKQIAEWRQETYNDLNKDLANFILKSKEDIGLITKGSSGALQNTNYKNASWVKSAVSDNDNVTASATSQSMNGTHEIKMKSLAKGVSSVSKNAITQAGGTKDNIASQMGLDKDGILEFTVSTEKGDVTFVIGNNQEKDKDGKETKASDNKGQDSDRVNNIVRLNKSLDKLSLRDIANVINNASVHEIGKDDKGKEKVTSSSPLGIQASYDSGLDKFLMKTKGEGQGVSLGLKVKEVDGAEGDDKARIDNGKAFVKALGLDFGESASKSLKVKDGSSYQGENIEVTSSVENTKTIAEILGTNEGEFKEFKININGNDFSIEKDTTVGDILTELGKNIAEKGLKISSVENESTPEEKKLSKELSKKLIDSLDLKVGVKSKVDGEDKVYEEGSITQDGKHVGTNAILESYKVDGVEMAGENDNIEYNSNNFTINGVNFTAKTTEASSITIDTNTDEIFDKITEFVKGYNEIIDKMNGLVSEKEYRDFKPLTTEERESMSDKEVELWEEKAKSGMLKGDEIVSRNIQTVRSGLYDTVEGSTGSFNHITNIGIATEKFVSGSAGGKLVIDEEALRESINRDANGVMELLFKQPTGDLAKDDSTLTPQQLKDKRAQSGIVTRIYDNLASGMKNIVDKSGLGESGDIIRKVRGRITSDFVIGGSRSRIDKQMSDYDKRIDQLNMFLKNKEESYYRQFTAMEKAMQKANSQMGWLEQQFGGGM